MEKKLRAPDRSGLKPEANGYAPADSGCEPDRHGSSPDAAGRQPDDSGLDPEAAGCEPDASGLKPDNSGSSPDWSVLGKNPRFPQFFRIFPQFKVGRRCSVAISRRRGSAALPHDQKGGDYHGQRPNCARER